MLCSERRLDGSVKDGVCAAFAARVPDSGAKAVEKTIKGFSKKMFTDWLFSDFHAGGNASGECVGSRFCHSGYGSGECFDQCCRMGA